MVAKDKVVEIFKASGAKAWRIYEGLNPSARSPWCMEYNADATNGDVIQQLEFAIDSLYPGNYTFFYTEHTKKSTSATEAKEKFNFWSGYRTVSFSVPADGTRMGAIGNAQQQHASPFQLKEGYEYISKAEIQERIDKAVANEKRFIELRHELDEIKGSSVISQIPWKEIPWGDVIGALRGGPIPQAFRPAAIAGPQGASGAASETVIASAAKQSPQSEQPETPEQQQAAMELVKASLNKLQKHFKTQTEFAKTLALLAEKVDQKPKAIDVLIGKASFMELL